MAIGSEALYTQSYNNGGAPWNSNNIAIGFESLYSNQPVGGFNGANNTAVGVQILRSNTTGYENTAIGTLALYDNQSGAFNTAIGYNALRSNISGNGNVALGNLSLYNNTMGSGNTAVGFSAGTSALEAPKNNTTAIGNGAITTASHQVRIGNTQVTDRRRRFFTIILFGDGGPR